MDPPKQPSQQSGKHEQEFKQNVKRPAVPLYQGGIIPLKADEAETNLHQIFIQKAIEERNKKEELIKKTV